MENKTPNGKTVSVLETQDSGSSLQVNFKRIFARALEFWYVVLLSILAAITGAYLYNRYATPVYSIGASIIIREGNENAAAEFLYKSNPLVNPYRNFYNEIYIMKSYPLIQRVVENLKLHISWFKEGDIKASEIYSRNFPVEIKAEPNLANGHTLRFEFKPVDENNFTVELLSEAEDVKNPVREARYDEPLDFGIATITFSRTAAIPDSWNDRIFLVVVRTPEEVAKAYSARLSASWAEAGASVVNLELKGTLPEKEITFLTEYIRQYQLYDLEKKNEVASRAIAFLDEQLFVIGDSLRYFDRQIQGFKQSFASEDFSSESERLLNQLQELELQRSQILLQGNYLNYLENYLSGGDGFDQVVPPSVLGINDNLLSGLIQKLTELQFSLRLLGQYQSDKNPMVIEQRHKISQLKNDILEGIRSIRSGHKINLSFLEKQIRDVEKNLDRIPATERELLNIKRNYSIRGKPLPFPYAEKGRSGHFQGLYYQRYCGG